MRITTTAPALAKGDWGNAPNKQSAKSATFALLAAMPGSLFHKPLPDGSQFCDPLKTQAIRGFRPTIPAEKPSLQQRGKNISPFLYRSNLHDLHTKNDPAQINRPGNFILSLIFPENREADFYIRFPANHKKEGATIYEKSFS